MPEERFRQRASQRRQKEILHAAQAEFSSQGCFRTSLDDVAAEVGVGKGTLYRHYGSKGELLRAALAGGVEDLQTRCQAIWVEFGAHPAVALHRLVSELVGSSRQQAPTAPSTLGRLRCCCLWSGASHAEDVGVERAVIPMLAACQAAGLFDTAADPKWIAGVMVALVSSPAITAHRSRTDQRRPDANSARREPPAAVDAADRIVELLQRAFGDRPGGAG